MLLRLFSGDKLGTALIILIFGIIIWLPSFDAVSTTAFAYQVEPMPFYRFIVGLFKGQVLLSKIFAFIFLLFQAFMIVRLNGRFILIQQKTFLPAFFFLAITGFYMPLLNLSEYLFASFFFIIMLDLLFSVYKEDSNSYRFFEAGLLLGIASLFYARLLYFLPFIWICSLILRPFFWREWVFPVVGTVLPYLVIFGIRFLQDKEPLGILETVRANLLSFNEAFQPKWNYLIIAAIIFLFIAISSGYMLRVYQFRKIYIRNYYLVFFWLFVLSLVFFVFMSRFDPGIVYLFALPVSFILSNYFLNSRKTLGNRILFGLFLLLVVLNSLFILGGG